MGEAEQIEDKAAGADAEALLQQVRELLLELHPRRGPSLHVTLDTALDRELGFDSLSRVELLLRLESAFRVSLPEQLPADARTRPGLRRGDPGGPLKSALTVAFEVLRAGGREARAMPGAALGVTAAADVIQALQGAAGDALAAAETSLGRPLGLTPDPARPRECFHVAAGDG